MTMASDSLSVVIVTFNCARIPVNGIRLAKDLFRRLHGTSQDKKLPDLFAFSLQEVAPIAQSFLGGSFLNSYYKNILQCVKSLEELAVSAPGRTTYQLIASRNVGMTGLLVFCRSELVQQVKWVEAGWVGVGDYGLGNKGAVALKLGWMVSSTQEVVPLAITAAHLAPMEWSYARRNQDWRNIAQGLVFERVTHRSGSALGKSSSQTSNAEREPLLASTDLHDTSREEEAQGILSPGTLLFFAGDLNYRTSDSAPEMDQDKNYPQPPRAGSSPSDFEKILSVSRKRDQLARERSSGNTLHTLDEAPVHFPPTYKYSQGQYIDPETGAMGSSATDVWPEDGTEPTTWHWAKHRVPSWCDRILFSSVLTSPLAYTEGVSPLTVSAYDALPVQFTSDHRPVFLALTLEFTPALMQALKQMPAPPISITSDWRTQRDYARYREIAVGAMAYLTLTWEGNGVLLASVLGGIGGYLMLRAMLD